MNFPASPAAGRRAFVRVLRIPALLFSAALFHCVQSNADAVVLQADRVNIRNAPSTDAEVIAWFKRGETVETRGPASNGWVRIALPPNVPVWAYGPLVDRARQRVRAKDLNLRNGPGKNYVELGKLAQGDSVSIIRESDGWLQIEPPAAVSAYVAASFLGAAASKVGVSETKAVVEPERPKTVPVEQVRADSNNSRSTIVATSPGATQPVVSEPRPTVPAQTPPPQPAPAKETFYITPEPPRSVVQGTQPLLRYSSEVRTVVRVGRVGLSLDPKSPAHFELESLNRGEGSLGDLITDDESIELKLYRDRIVRVVAEEYIDAKTAPRATLKVKSIQGDTGR